MPRSRLPGESFAELSIEEVMELDLVRRKGRKEDAAAGSLCRLPSTKTTSLSHFTLSSSVSKGDRKWTVSTSGRPSRLKCGNNPYSSESTPTQSQKLKDDEPLHIEVIPRYTHRTISPDSKNSNLARKDHSS